ncbi:MAG: TIGR00730 family Rossman fold protein [Paracoccaceae bacterium]|nr:TIGR00730 family Rossman fold protein [Paracoccaceae bacterium]
MIKQNIKSICVFCGSRDGSNVKYTQAAKELGQLMAKQKFSLVYGGGNVGLMGSIASESQKKNNEVLGVIPNHLMEKEVGEKSLNNLVITKNMHERKMLMYKKSDAFIILPGGVGTLDEFFETLTWAQLNIHKKPIILLNIGDFWNPLINLLNHQIKLGFVNITINKLFVTVSTPKEAINYLLDSKRQLSPE